MTKKNQMSEDNKKYYSKLLIFPKRRSLLAILVVGYIVFYASVIFQETLLQKDWIQIALPIMLAGVILIAFPATETWEYAPWQSEPERHEQLSRND
ncbi:MAG: hypothetical protein AB7T49_09045 [Oligoflexales bacterium]